MKKMAIIKVSSVVLLAVVMLWYISFWATTDTSFRLGYKYNEAITSETKDDLREFNLCNPEDMPDLCPQFQALADLDGNPGFSNAEDQVRKAIHLLVYSASESHERVKQLSWVVLVLSVAFAVNLLYDLKNKK